MNGKVFLPKKKKDEITQDNFREIVSKVFDRLGIVATNVTETRGDVPVNECIPLGPVGNGNCLTNVNTHTITLPASGSRPACPDMKVQYVVKICYNIPPLPGQSPLTVEISQFEAWLGNCPAFIAWYNSLSNIDKGIQQDKWEYEASVIEEQALIYALLTDTQIIGCHENWSATSSVYTDLCITRCLVEVPVWPYFKTVKSYCGTQCCIRTTNYCVNYSNVLIFQPPVFNTIGDKCINIEVKCTSGIPLGDKCGVECGPK